MDARIAEKEVTLYVTADGEEHESREAAEEHVREVRAHERRKREAESLRGFLLANNCDDVEAERWAAALLRWAEQHGPLGYVRVVREQERKEVSGPLAEALRALLAYCPCDPDINDEWLAANDTAKGALREWDLLCALTNPATDG